MPSLARVGVSCLPLLALREGADLQIRQLTSHLPLKYSVRVVDLLRKEDSQTPLALVAVTSPRGFSRGWSAELLLHRSSAHPLGCSPGLPAAPWGDGCHQIVPISSQLTTEQGGLREAAVAQPRHAQLRWQLCLD